MDLSDNEQYADNRRVAEEAAQAAGWSSKTSVSPVSQ